jgi:hypothetical protein
MVSENNCSVNIFNGTDPKTLKLKKVVKPDIKSDEMCIFTVTDATLVTYCLHFGENEIHATSEVMIIIFDPSLNHNKIKKDTLVQLSVTMQMSLVPDSSCDTYA